MNYTAPMTDEHLAGLRRRNELRLHHARLQLGERWLLHPANAVRADLGSKMHRITREFGNTLLRAGLIEPAGAWMKGFSVQQVMREMRL